MLLFNAMTSDPYNRCDRHGQSDTGYALYKMTKDKIEKINKKKKYWKGIQKEGREGKT